MKIQFSRFFVSVCFFLLPPILSHAAINLPWSTTFNYSSDCTQRGGGGAIDCANVQNDGISWSWGAAAVNGNYTQANSAANNPSGGGGRGFRTWVGDGQNVGSGPVRVSFSSPQKELWIRWYMRYEKGFQWSTLGYDKMLYINTGTSGTSAIAEWVNGDGYSVIAQNTPNYYQLYANPGAGWTTTMGGSVSDGQWHLLEIYMKMDTNGTNGKGRFWIDGVLKASNDSMNWSGGNSTAQQGWKEFEFHSNQNSPANGKAMAVDYDDFAIYNATPPNVDAHGNPFIGPIGGSVTAAPPSSEPTTSEPTSSEPSITVTTLFEEKFEDSNFSGRGWYDNTSPVLSSAQAIPGSTKSLEFRFPTGATKPTAGGAMRKKFADTDAIYVSYYVKYSENWQGSNRSYHPHEFYLLTNKDGDWSGLANTHLTAYIEQNEGTPLVAIQDGLNIDQSRINQDLTGVTESRGVAGCNGDSDGFGPGTCYLSGSSYVNGKSWRASKVYFSDTTGPYYKYDWHKVEAYLKLNSVVNGKAVADGLIQYWFDGQLVMDHKNVMLRTGQHPDMKFNQFIIAPWIGDGSPVDQTFWIDNLTVATGASGTETAPTPSAPTGLRITSLQ